MADTPDTPTTTDDAKPTPRRRAAPRKATTSTAKPRRAVKTAADKAAGAATKASKPAKPRSTKRATTRSPSVSKSVAGAVLASKPKASTTTAKRTPGRKRAGAKSTLDKATAKVGGKWGAAGIVGGIAAAGAAAAALLTLRGSSGKNVGTTRKPIDISGTGDKEAGHPVDVHAAHQPDGKDSSASFKAGIADENTIPAKV